MNYMRENDIIYFRLVYHIGYTYIYNNGAIQ